jgi:hypothetical protein
MKNIVDIYAFGIFDEHGSEYADKATPIPEDRFLTYCEERGYKKDYVIEKMKQFKIFVA